MNSYITSENNTHPYLACIDVQYSRFDDRYDICYYGDSAETVSVYGPENAIVLIKYYTYFGVPVQCNSIYAIQELQREYTGQTHKEAPEIHFKHAGETRITETKTYGINRDDRSRTNTGNDVQLLQAAIEAVSNDISFDNIISIRPSFNEDRVVILVEYYEYI